MKNFFTLDHGFWVVLALAFGLRMAGIHFGLPSIFHQDEPIIVNHALAMGAEGWNTHFFVLPPFVTEALFIVYAIIYTAGHLLHVFPDPDLFAIAFLKDPTLFYVLGRILFGAAAGTATVALLWAIGKRFFSRETGFLSALFLAVLFFHTQQSHYLYVDVPLTLATTLLVYGALRILKEGSTKSFIFAGVALGWAVSIKYTALYFLPTVLAAYVLVFLRQSLKPAHLGKLVLAGLASLGIFFILAPYTFLDSKTFLTQMSAQAGAESPVGLWHHLRYSLLEGTGFFFLAASVWGAVLLFIERRKEAILLIGTVVFYCLVNAFFSQRYARYMLPMAPVLSLFAGYSFMVLFRTERKKVFFKSFIFGFFLIGLLLPTVYSDFLFSSEDTRTQALRWFYKNVSERSVVVLDNRFNSPRLEPTREQVFEKYKEAPVDSHQVVKKKRLDLELRAANNGPVYTVYVLMNQNNRESPFLFAGPYVKMDLDDLRKIGAGYLVVNYAYDNSRVIAFMKSEPGVFEKVAVFTPYHNASRRWSGDRYASTAAPHAMQELFSRRRLGPYIEVYRIRQ